jgi:hypothetical protein
MTTCYRPRRCSKSSVINTKENISKINIQSGRKYTPSSNSSTRQDKIKSNGIEFAFVVGNYVNLILNILKVYFVFQKLSFFYDKEIRFKSLVKILFKFNLKVNLINYNVITTNREWEFD